MDGCGAQTLMSALPIHRKTTQLTAASSRVAATSTVWASRGTHRLGRHSCNLLGGLGPGVGIEQGAQGEWITGVVRLGRVHAEQRQARHVTSK